MLDAMAGIVAILGSTYTGEYEDVKAFDAELEKVRAPYHCQQTLLCHCILKVPPIAPAPVLALLPRPRAAVCDCSCSAMHAEAIVSLVNLGAAPASNPPQVSWP